MHGKIYRFIFVESRFEALFMAFFAIVIFSGLEIAAVFVLNTQIKEGEVLKTLIVRIPEMESILYPKARQRPTMIANQAPEPVRIGNNVYILNGIQELNNKPTALINDDVYQEGDLIENYSISKITINSVLLKDLKTDEMKILRLGN
ncbi:MAG: hypothetical protein KAR32_13120 [Candidatus Omnitrophica bacterium]|nr:hypothetical protein [Candidatus Omnitrophota bacterium]